MFNICVTICRHIADTDLCKYSVVLDAFLVIVEHLVLLCGRLWTEGVKIIASCARGDTICLRPLQVDSIFVFIRQVAPVPACWLFKASATS